MKANNNNNNNADTDVESGSGSGSGSGNGSGLVDPVVVHVEQEEIEEAYSDFTEKLQSFYPECEESADDFHFKRFCARYYKHVRA